MDTDLLVDGSVISRSIATDAITSDKVFANAITTSKIATNAVTANEIAALTIVAGNIASNAITAAKIAALQIEAGHIKSNAITADKIEAGAITTVKLAANAITADKIIVGDFTNVADGSDFEIAEANPWDISAAAFGISTTASRAHSGTRSLSISGASTGTARLKNRVTVNEGERWYVEFWASRSGTWDGTINNSKLRIGNQSGSHIYSLGYTPATIGAANQPPVLLSGEFTIPAGTTELNITLGNDATTGTVWLDDIVIRRMTDGRLIVNGAIDGKTITGATVQTTATANRGIILDSTRFSAYNNSGVETVRINANDGSATFTGTLRNRPSGPRVEMVASDTRARIYMFTQNTTSQPPSIQAAIGDDGIQMTSGTPSGTTQYSGVALDSKGTGTHATWGLGSLNSEIWVGAHINGTSDGVATMYGANGYMRVGSDGTCYMYRSSSQYLNFTSAGVTQAVASAFNVFGNFTVNNGAKNFVMDHPTKPGKQLQHASSESPHNGVEYWSDGLVQLPEDGQLTVTLPEYFEGLTAADHRSVLLTAGSPNADLWASPVEDGSFVVHGAPGALFSWLVKARRVLITAGEDILAFPVELDAQLLEPFEPESE